MQKIFSFFNQYSLLISISFLVILFLAFFPQTFTTVDEYGYLANSRNLIHSNLRQECHPYEPAFYPVKDYCVPKYNIGTSLFLATTAAFPQRISFIIPFLTFLTGIIYFSKLLKFFKIQQIYLYFFAFFPTFIYFSRTLLSETFSAVLVLIIFYYLLKFFNKQKLFYGILIGLLGGLLVLVKYSNAILLIILLGGFFFQNVKKFSIKQNMQLIYKVLLGALPIIIFFFWINNYLYGNPLRSGYFYSHEQSLFVISNVPLMTIRYFLILNLLYPGMLISNFLTKFKYRNLILATIITFILFFSTFPGNNGAFQGRILDLILGARFLIPVIPLSLLLYFQWLNRLIKERFQGIILLTILIMALVITLESLLHQNFLLHYQFAG
ncbi:MAG: hypothetical protein WCJ58_03345 [bacterium]